LDSLLRFVISLPVGLVEDYFKSSQLNFQPDQGVPYPFERSMQFR
jgi:hypothetical protein